MRFLSFLGSILLWGAAAMALKPRGKIRSKFHMPSSLNVRGGGGIMSDKNVVVGINTASCAVIGSTFAIAPHIASDIYDAPTEKHSLDNICVSGVGALVLNWAITTHLTVNKLCSVQEAIALGHLPLLMLVAKDWLTSEYKRADVGTTFLYTVAIIDTALCTCMLNGLWNPVLASKILAVFLGVQGFIAWAAPVLAGKILIDRDLSGSDKSQGWFMALGINRVSTSVLCGALAFGVDPMKAVAYGTIPFVLMSAETLFVRKGFDAMGGNWPIHYKFLLFQLSSIIYMILGGKSPAPV